MTWLIQTIQSSLSVASGSALRRSPVSTSWMTRWATATVRAASASTSPWRRFAKYAADDQRERQDRDDRREHDARNSLR